jgi:hypothetical protein
MSRRNDIKINSMSVKIVAVIGIMMFLFGCERNGDYDFKVEGLHYLDNEPVEIEIKDGKISGIKKIKSLSG